MDEATDLGDGIVRIAVPITGLPIPNTLVYALESPGGVVLVDAGWNDEPSWTGLTEGLAAIGHSVNDVEGVVLTHFHPDHSGLAGRVRESSGAWIGMHAADWPWFDKASAPRTEEWLAAQLENLARAGTPAADREAFARASRAQGTSIGPESAPDRALSDGEVIPLAGRGLRAVATPGHTPGHLCFHLDDADVMFTGDHVLQKTTPHVGNFDYPLGDRDALGEFFDSLRRVRAMGVTRGLGAHGRSIADLGGRAGELLDHHERRLADLAGAFDGEALTLWQLAMRMSWHRPWEQFDPMSKSMALSEAAAHVQQLVARGVVDRIPGAEPATFAVAARVRS